MAAPSIRLNSGHEMPMLGLGTSMSEDVEKAIDCAIECGYRLIDSAWIYQNENEIGKAVSKLTKARRIKREDVFITSRLWSTFHNPKDVRNALMDSMKKLQTDYLDLYFLHWPFSFVNNGEHFPKDEAGNILHDDVDYVDTWKAMEELQREGLVRSIGVSNFNEFQINRILKECSIPPAVNQVEIHPYLSQTKLVDYCKEKGITVTAYSQFGSPARAWHQPNNPVVLKEPKLLEIAARMKKTVGQVILRYLIQRDITVIPKSAAPERIKNNIQVFDFVVSKDDMDAIDDLNRDFRIFFFSQFIDCKYFPFKDNYSE